MKKNIVFLVTHGTDTMAWGLSYLTYALKNHPHAVALVGSQRPMTAMFSSSDGYANIELAVNTLVRSRNPLIFLAFDNGKKLFHYSIWKKDKWDTNAFCGNLLAMMDSNYFIYLDKVLRRESRLDTLYLLRTGGTIESGFTGDEGILSPIPDSEAVLSYLRNEFEVKKRFIKEVVDIPVTALDSSDLTEDEWKRVANLIVQMSNKDGYYSKLDSSFCSEVRVIHATPFHDADFYSRSCEGARGLIFVGYGAGNVNIRRDTPNSPISSLEDINRKGVPVILTSHAIKGIIDSVYENGAEVFKLGLALPAADFSIARAQVKLGFILGHEKEIESAVREIADERDPIKAKKKVISTLFLSGAHFANSESRDWFEQQLELQIPNDDLMINREFEDAMDIALDYVKGRREVSILSGITKPEELLINEDHPPSVVIVKPDEQVGENRMGVEIDASQSLAAILCQSFEWDIRIVDLWRVQAKEEDLIDSLIDNTIVFWEGGRPSVYNPGSYNELSERDGEDIRDFYLSLYKGIIKRRAHDSDFPPSVFICLSHQMIAQALYELLRETFSLADTTIPAKARNDWNRLVDEYHEMRDRLEIGQIVTSLGRKERGLVYLKPYSINRELPDKIKNAHLEVSKTFSGFIEDILPKDRIEIPMLHSDEVNDLQLLFINWALWELYHFKSRNGLTREAPFYSLPVGVEITSSTFDKKGLPLTEVASFALYYIDGNGAFYRDFSFQFHPELIGHDTITYALPGEPIQLSFRNDGVKILISTIFSCMEKNMSAGIFNGT